MLSGKTQWIAMDDIISVYEFKDLDEMKTLGAIMQEMKEKQESKQKSEEK